MDLARRYVRKIYNRFEATLVPSARLGQVLTDWGVENVRAVDLGVDVEIFRPQPSDAVTRESLGHSARTLPAALRRAIGPGKEHADSFAAFELLTERDPQLYHLLVVGDGLQRAELRGLQERTRSVTWRQYCTDSEELAHFIGPRICSFTRVCRRLSA